MMKKSIASLLMVFLSLGTANVHAAGVKVELDKAPIDIYDKESLRRGMENFADYCLSCHAASFMRYNRVAKDLEIEESEVREKMIFTRGKKGEPTKIGELMRVSMTDEYAQEAFGTKVPDLSLSARSRGADWLYTYLRTFYADPYRPTGANNKVFPDVGMPHVLASLQGMQKAVYTTEVHDGVESEKITGFEKITEGSMSADEFDAFTADLVNFMVYVAEPVQVERKTLGWKVLLFLFVFGIFAYLLKKEYWKDVH